MLKASVLLRKKYLVFVGGNHETQQIYNSLFSSHRNGYNGVCADQLPDL